MVLIGMGELPEGFVRNAVKPGTVVVTKIALYRKGSARLGSLDATSLNSYSSIMEFQHVKNEGIELQSHLPWLEMVAVGGTAVAMHAGHRFSTDIDNVTPLLKQEFDVVAEQLDKWDGWKTHRLNRPVIILGERHQVELGVRQQRRTIPIESELKDGLLIPTLDEALRIKAYLLATRKATRDYLDVAALSDKLGPERTVSALRPLNYIYHKACGNLSALSQFSSAVHEAPADFGDVNLSDYKGIISPYNKWSHVSAVCSRVGTTMFEAEMTDPLLSLEGRSFGTVADIRSAIDGETI